VLDWPALVGAIALPMGVLLVVARWGLPPGRAAVARLLGAGMAFGVLAPAASVLAVKTHHRALGGVTFAVFAALLVAATSMVTTRCEELARANPRLATPIRAAMWILAATSLAAIARPSVEASRSVELGPLRDVVVGPMLLALSFWFGRQRVLRRFAGPGAALWGLAVLASLIVLRASDATRAGLVERTPLAAGVAGALTRP
jgi:hypothetical protein